MLITPADYKAIVKGSELLDSAGARIFDYHVRSISEGVICEDKALFESSVRLYLEDFSCYFESVKGNFLRPEGLKKTEDYIKFLEGLVS